MRPQRLKARSKCGATARLNSLRKKCFQRRSVTSAAEAGAENKPGIAAVKRCATQSQVLASCARRTAEGGCPYASFSANCEAAFFQTQIKNYSSRTMHLV